MNFDKKIWGLGVEGLTPEYLGVVTPTPETLSTTGWVF